VSAHSQALGSTSLRRRPAFSFRRWTEREGVFSWLMVIPPVLFLVALVGYPFVYGIWLSLEERPVAKPGVFIGLSNFIGLVHDPVFWQVAQNTFVYTIAATVLKMIGGLALALVLNQDFKFKNIIRAVMLLPFIVPTVLSTIAWMWILDPSFSVVNWFLVHWGIANPGPSWLGNPKLAMFSLIMVNTWRGLPFYAITLLAGLQTISPELYEAATIDGASTFARFRYITAPLLKPVVFIVTMFSVIFTFSDFQLVYVLTRGGPANATHLFATYAFDVAMSGGQFGLGAAIALSMLPPLALLIAGMAWYMRSEKT
jgi:multiple sugar transport system permease protein